ncbi:MAG TPA: protein-glutamate O-methyltransferase [Phycisphaerae bacterium]|nr:protein-glutamate O-methyltransferase [Phycisphaerae bacterium]
MAIITANIQDLTRDDYEIVRRMVYEHSGINLGEQKMQLVRSRLGKLVRQNGYPSYRAYIDKVVNDKSGQELCTLLDAISTNTTHLFREKHHFDFLARVLREWTSDARWCSANREVRIWCAASSSGEEPYSIAMTADDVLRNVSGVGLKILATDISTRMLAKAKAGVFEAERIETVPGPFRQRYLRKAAGRGEDLVEVVPELKRFITFSRFNLMTPTFPFRHGFNVVFCRNVMIYFDRATQQTLVNKMAHHLHGGGYLLIGHSESLNNIKHNLAYVEPTVYRK